MDLKVFQLLDHTTQFTLVDRPGCVSIKIVVKIGVISDIPADMSFQWQPVPLVKPTSEEQWALATMLEEEAKMEPCPPAVLSSYKVQV